MSHCLGVVSVAVHPCGVIACSTSLDSFVPVFDIDSNATIATLETPPSEVWQMQFDPKVLARNNSESIFLLGWSIGTTLAVTGGGSASIKLWDIATWRLIATLSIPSPEGPKPTDNSSSKKFVLSVAWSPDDDAPVHMYGTCMTLREKVWLG